jgi:ribose 5-phosphate isomerase A
MNDTLPLEEQEKKNAAEKALEFIPEQGILGVGTGSTMAYFIKKLANYRSSFQGAVSSSEETSQLLTAEGITLLDPNSAPIDVYIDGADEANALKQLVKGGKGALTREKILANIAKRFVCVLHYSKYKTALGHSPLAIEVHPMARSYVARKIMQLGGTPVYRAHFITDNGNPILDVTGLDYSEPLALEHTLNNIVGVMAHGLFAQRGADHLIIGHKDKTILV